MISIRRIRSGEGSTLREVRLAALLDTPSAFGRSHDEETQFPAEEWEQRASAWSEGVVGATFFAERADGDGAAVVGLVGAHRPGDGTVELVSMWSAPEARGAGVGRALVQAVLEWAGDDQVWLWVTRGNDPALRLYQRCGFVTTGDFQPLPSDPCKDEIRMCMG